MEILQQLFLPHFCVGCFRPGVLICNHCNNKNQPVTNHLCFYCKKESPYGFTHEKCRRRLGIDGILSVYRYNGVASKVLRTIKYQPNKTVLCEVLKNIPLKTWFFLINYRAFIKNTNITYVPQVLCEYRVRGFNQSYILATHLSDFLKVPLHSVVIKSCTNKKQALLKEKTERIQNVKNVFQIDKDAVVKGKKYIIVDDVVTTGSTVAEIAKILKRKGAKEVLVFCLFRAR